VERTSWGPGIYREDDDIPAGIYVTQADGIEDDVAVWCNDPYIVPPCDDGPLAELIADRVLIEVFDMPDDIPERALDLEVVSGTLTPLPRQNTPQVPLGVPLDGVYYYLETLTTRTFTVSPGPDGIAEWCHVLGPGGLPSFSDDPNICDYSDDGPLTLPNSTSSFYVHGILTVKQSY